MPLALSKTDTRLWSLDSGVAMVVTDLHGDWPAYAHYRDRFLALHAAGQADCLILTGDLIHRKSPAGPDQSLEIVLDVLALRERMGDAIIYLCGNHELPHLYGFVLGKGAVEYTPVFEAAMNASGRRDQVLGLFASLPFFIRTAAGVSITHAGAPPLPDAPTAQRLFGWDHRQLRDWATAQLAQGDIDELRSGYAQLSGASDYAILAQHYLSLRNPDDPRYDDLLRGMLISAYPDFALLRAALFTRCELEVGEAIYAQRLASALERLSYSYRPQRWLVAGHMATSGGHALVLGRHLRVSSATHAWPRHSARYLLLDAQRPPEDSAALIAGLHAAT